MQGPIAQLLNVGQEAANQALEIAGRGSTSEAAGQLLQDMGAWGPHTHGATVAFRLQTAFSAAVQVSCWPVQRCAIAHTLLPGTLQHRLHRIAVRNMHCAQYPPCFGCMEGCPWLSGPVALQEASQALASDPPPDPDAERRLDLQQHQVCFAQLALMLWPT